MKSEQPNQNKSKRQLVHNVKTLVSIL